MATTNYNLPTITGASPVAIVDDYNALANATDAALAGAISGEKTRAMAAETELANGVSNALATANSANVSATDAKTAADKASTAAAAEATRATAAENALSADIANVKAMFPVDSANLADGAVTAPKLADTALNAIWQGLEIKRFDSTDSTADNTGMAVASNVNKLAGFYIPALTMLVITAFDLEDTGYSLSKLPDYVPVPTAQTTLASGGMVSYNDSTDFLGWHVLQYRENGYLATSNYKGSGKQLLLTPAIAYLAPFVTTSYSASTISDDFAVANGTVGNA